MYVLILRNKYYTTTFLTCQYKASCFCWLFFTFNTKNRQCLIAVPVKPNVILSN